MSESKEAENAMTDGARALAGCPPNLRIKFYEGVYQASMLSRNILEAQEQLDRLHARWKETTGAPYEPESEPDKVVGLPERTTEHDIDVIRQAYHILGAHGHQWRGPNDAKFQELLNDLRDLLARATGKTSQEVQDKLPVWPDKQEPEQPAQPQAKDVVIPRWEEPKEWAVGDRDDFFVFYGRIVDRVNFFAASSPFFAKKAVEAYNLNVDQYRSRIAQLEGLLISMGAKLEPPQP